MVLQEILKEYKKKKWMVIYTIVKSVMSITDTKITNVIIIPNGAGVRNIRVKP